MFATITKIAKPSDALVLDEAFPRMPWCLTGLLEDHLRVSCLGGNLSLVDEKHSCAREPLHNIFVDHSRPHL